MTDDLGPRLRDHLRQRAGRISAAPDVADVHHRITERRHRRTRALGAALATSLVVGPVAGWAAGRASDEPRDTVSASGGAGGDASGDDVGGPPLEGSGPGYLDPQMDPVSDRTTAEGIRLVVRSTILGPPEGDLCSPDGLVRVGIVDGDLIDVALFESAPSRASFGIAGGADGRPMWVVVARAAGPVEATFPNGASDRTDPVQGVAVLAAYAGDGASATDLVDDVVEVSGIPGELSAESREIGLAGAECATTAPPPEQAMPEPGEPPADEEAARAAIEELWLQSSEGPNGPEDADLHERPEVWVEAQARFREEHPDYYEWSKEVYGVVHEIVFTAPDRASVRYSLVTDNPSIPAPGERIGEAVLIDGTWKVAIETACGNLALAGIECDFSIDG